MLSRHFRRDHTPVLLLLGHDIMARRHFPLLMDVGMAGATRAGKTTARRGTVISSENLSPLLVQFAARADNTVVLLGFVAS